MCITFVYLLLYMVCTYKHLLLVNKQSIISSSIKLLLFKIQNLETSLLSYKENKQFLPLYLYQQICGLRYSIPQVSNASNFS